MSPPGMEPYRGRCPSIGVVHPWMECRYKISGQFYWCQEGIVEAPYPPRFFLWYMPDMQLPLSFLIQEYIWVLARIISSASPRICRHISCNLPTCTYPFSDPEARCWLKNPIKKRVCGVGVRCACPTRFSSGEGPSWNVRTTGTKTYSAAGKIHGSKTCRNGKP